MKNKKEMVEFSILITSIFIYKRYFISRFKLLEYKNAKSVQILYVKI